MRVLVASDIHLTNYNKFNHDVKDYPESGSRLETILSALDQYFTQGAKLGVNHYVINGDLFDKRLRENPSTYSYLVTRVINSFNENTLKNSQLYLNVGNHDELTRDIVPNSLSVFKLFDNVHVMDRNIVDLVKLDDNSGMLFVPYTENIIDQKNIINKVITKYLEDFEDNSVTVFAHLGIEGGTQGRWQHRLCSAYSLNDLLYDNPKINRIVLGHYHNRQFIKNGDKQVYYVGDLVPLSFNDVSSNGSYSHRGFDLLDTSNNDKVEFFRTTLEDDKVKNTFNVIDYDKLMMNLGDYEELSQDNFIRIECTQDEAMLLNANESPLDNFNRDNVELSVKQVEMAHIDDMALLDDDNTPKEIVGKFCEKYYPDIKPKAFEYLEKVNDVND